MIQEFREYSESLGFKIILGIVAVSLVISLGVGSFFGDRKEVVAVVNGREILMKDFRRAYSNRLEALRQQLGENTERFAEQMNLRQQVMQQLVDQELLLSEAEELNVMVTDLELQDYIRQQPYFQRNGQFDANVYKEVLRQNRIPLFEYEDGLRRDLLVQKKQRLLGIGLAVSDTEVERAYRQQYEQVELNYVHFDPEAFLDQVAPTDEELQAYHEAHPDEFQSEAQYQVEFFTLKLSQFNQADKVREREVRRYYERNLDRFTSPPEVKARHILFKLDPEASDVLKEERRTALESVRARIVAGEDFAAVAQELSEDLSAQQGGDLGWFKPGEMVPAFEQAAFELAPGELSQVVESPFGLHLIQVDDRKEQVEQSLDDVREEIVGLLADQRAESDLEEALVRVDDTVGRKPLAELAASYNSAVQDSQLFSRETVVEGIGSVSGLIGQLDGKPLEAAGVWQRNPVQGHVVWKLTAYEEPKPLDFEAAREQVLEAVRREQALERAKAEAAVALEQAQQGVSLTSLAEARGLEVAPMQFAAGTRFLPELGDNQEFRKVALHLSADQAFGLSENGNRVDLIEFQQRSLDDTDREQRKAAVRASLKRLQQQAILEKEVKRLRETASIEITTPLLQMPGA